MSYDLAVWEGERPENDAAAAAFYERLIERLEEEEPQSDPEPVSEGIAAYVAALLARWPDITEDGVEASPWADGPLINNAFGSAIYFSMVWSQAEEASEFAANLARQHGLVCFDPQSEALRPQPASGTSARDARPERHRGWRGIFRRR